MDNNNRGIIASSSIILPFFLCFLFTFSSARNPFESAMIDIIDHINHDPLSLYENSNSLAQDDPNSILIPIDDKPEPKPEPATVIHLEPEPKTTNSKLPEPNKPETVYSTIFEVPEEMSKTSLDPNAAFITSDLRPIDPRSIPRRQVPLSFHFGHRCNHHHVHQNRINPHYKPWKPAQQQRRNNDVKVNGVEEQDNNKEFDRVARDDDWAREVSAEPMKLVGNNIEQKLSRERDLALERNELWRRMYPRHHRHKAKNKDDTTGQLMKRIRKFLIPF